jgi:tetratricopeptide (TPR) repeat protein
MLPIPPSREMFSGFKDCRVPGDGNHIPDPGREARDWGPSKSHSASYSAFGIGHFLFGIALVAGFALSTGGCRIPRWRGPSVADFAAARQLSQHGLRAMRAGRMEEAEKAFRAAIKRCPHDPQQHQRFAEFLVAAGRHQEALEEFLLASQLAVDDPYVRVKACELALSLGEIALAETLIREAIALQPQNAPAWVFYGRVLTARREFRQAVEAYSRALDLAPDDHQARMELARLHRLLHEPGKSLVTLQAITAAYFPGDIPAEVLFELGLAYAALGRRSEAAEALLAAQAKNPRNPEYKKVLAALTRGNSMELALDFSSAENLEQRGNNFPVDPAQLSKRLPQEPLSQASYLR